MGAEDCDGVLCEFCPATAPEGGEEPEVETEPVEECGACATTSDCMSGYFCCPYQNLCIPGSSADCLCYGGSSTKNGVIGDNNERVLSGAEDCGGDLCEFCPATAPEDDSQSDEEEETIILGYVPECTADSPGWPDHRTLFIPHTYLDTNLVEDDFITLWADKLCCIYTYIEVSMTFSTPYLVSYDGTVFDYVDASDFEATVTAAMDEICAMSMGSEECADEDIVTCMATAETNYLLPDGPPESEESESEPEPEQSEEPEPEQSEEPAEPEQSEEPEPDQSEETETETDSGELSDGAGAGQAVQTHGSPASALSSGMACLMVALLSVWQL